MIDTNGLKKQAAEEAVKYIVSGMIVGLGTGSTVYYALQRISELLAIGELEKIYGIPSSIHTAQEAQKLGIPLSSLDDHPRISITIDGADEVDPQLNLIKGGGGALLREKILAQNSKREIIIIDQTKLVPQLGNQHALPVEVLPFACRSEMNSLESLGAEVTLRTNKDGSIYKTDQENLILDCQFGPIADPHELAQLLSNRAGIMEHGLFLGLTSLVIVAGEGGIRRLTPSKPAGS